MNTVLPWHREADKEANACARAIVSLVEKQTGKELRLEDCMKITKCVRVAIETCGRHDPHAAQNATTLRLLELSLKNNQLMADTYGLRDDIELCAEIRAHLAAMKGTR